MKELLTREQFRNSVFERDGHMCVICARNGKGYFNGEELDAHHIIDRKQFPDGGYYIDNGVTLCPIHHMQAESDLISCQDLRDKAKITHILLPDSFDETFEYNKWGEILPVDNKCKYPRTPHFSFSLGATNDDKIQYDLSNFEGKEVIISEKMDGENSSCMRDTIYARSLGSNNHPSRNWLKGLWGSMCYNIPENWRICGENLYAKHSIYYDNLPSYFLVFNIWNENNICLSWNDTIEWCELLGLEHVPVLYRGIFDIEQIKTICANLDPEKQEGLVVRLADSFKFSDFNKSVVKYVRKNHVQTDEHWATQKIIPNKLRNEH